MKKCPICGKPVEGDLNVCVECFIDRNEVFWLDDIIELTKCPRCEFFKIRGKWRDISFEEALIDTIYSSLRVHPHFNVCDVSVQRLAKGEVGKYIVILSGDMFNKPISVEKVVDVRVLREVCVKCTREAGGYYEAIVQIRADERKIDDEELKIVTKIIDNVLMKEKENPKAFISKIVERKEGIDYYFGDRNIGRKIARMIVNELGGKIIESKKIHTRRDGQDVYRFTYAVRLPPFRKGDVVVEDGKVCLVTNQRLGKAIVLESGDTINLKNPKVIARREDILSSVVVNCDEFAVEVINPLTNEVVYAKRPKIDLKPGDEVYLIEYNDLLYVIPKMFEL